MDSDCGSPGSAAGGPGLQITQRTRSESANMGGVSPSPSSQRPASRSPSPEIGHRRTQTQRVRDLLSTIDKLVMESEQPEDAPAGVRPLSASNINLHRSGGSSAAAAAAGSAAPRGRGVPGNKRQSTGGIMDPRNGGGGGRSSLLNLHSPPPRGDEGGNDVEDWDEHSPAQRAFFPNERDAPPPELASHRASVIPAPGAEEEDDPASADKLLSEVGAHIIANAPAFIACAKSKSSDPLWCYFRE